MDTTENRTPDRPTGTGPDDRRTEQQRESMVAALADTSESVTELLRLLGRDGEVPFAEASPVAGWRPRVAALWERAQVVCAVLDAIGGGRAAGPVGMAPATLAARLMGEAVEELAEVYRAVVLSDWLVARWSAVEAAAAARSALAEVEGGLRPTAESQVDTRLGGD